MPKRATNHNMRDLVMCPGKSIDFCIKSNGEYHANKIHQYYSLLCISRYRMDMLATTVRVASRKGKQNPARDGPYAITEIEMVFKQAAGACVRGDPTIGPAKQEERKKEKRICYEKQKLIGWTCILALPAATVHVRTSNRTAAYVITNLEMPNIMYIHLYIYKKKYVICVLYAPFVCE